jgi:hypothetical protein
MSLVPEEVRDGRIGRFPVWAIGVLVAGAIILFLFIRNRNRNATPEQTDPSVPGEGLVENVDGIPPLDFVDQIGGNFPSNVSLAPAPQRPVTNAQWLIAAFDFLIGLSKNPITAQRALQKYLAGEGLNDEERALVEQATANPNISLPPEGVNLPPVVTVPPAGTNPPSGGTQPSTATAPAGVNLYDWASSQGVDFVALFGMYKGDPRALNPTARSYMSWDNSKPKVPTFKTARTVRIR